MRFRKTRHTLALVLAGATAFGIAACEDAFTTEVDVDLPASERELVIEATVRPGDSSFVYVSRTRGILEDFAYEHVGGAEVTLRVDAREVATFTEATSANTGVSRYGARVPDGLFVPGAVFELTVVSPRGERAVAQQTAPAPGRLRSVSASGQDYSKALTFTVEDAAGEAGYLVEAYYTSYVISADTTRPPAERFDSTVAPMYLSTGEDFDYVDYDFRFTTTDAGFADATAAFRLNASPTSIIGCGAGCEDLPRNRVRVSLRTVNRQAAAYYDGLRQLDLTYGNPFVEPIVLPRGFEGARGMMILEGGVSEVSVAVE